MKYVLLFVLGIIAGGVGVASFLKHDGSRSDSFVSIAGSPPTSPERVDVRSAPSTVRSNALPLEAVAVPPTTIASAQKPTPAPAKNADAPEASSPSERLLIPVAGITAAQLTDTFNQARGTERRHEALDILAKKGTEVLAVADGKIMKLFDSKPGGITLYQFDATEKFAYYYAHLDRYATGIVEGKMLQRGELVGYVGSTGNADPAAPHLHFAMFELGPEKRWWQGTPVNPFPLFGGEKRP